MFSSVFTLLVLFVVVFVQLPEQGLAAPAPMESGLFGIFLDF
jgi:hypothetical protein